MKLNKRTRLTISILVGILFFVMFQGLINSAAGEIILFGASTVYGLATLRVTGVRDYGTLFSILGILGFFTVFVVMNFIDSNYSYGESIYKGSFIGFLVIGTPMIFISMFMMKKRKNKQKQDLA
ncbi:hypothetical protein AAGG74_16970 [Bacillus mexicanus]|uniref:hypothetical protein n=1 Tax=Bacillus mexicanus TaxID=2834415 RepID=UPI003D19373C